MNSTKENINKLVDNYKRCVEENELIMASYWSYNISLWEKKYQEEEELIKWIESNEKYYSCQLSDKIDHDGYLIREAKAIMCDDILGYLRGEK